MDLNEWNVFKSKRLHLIHLNINSLVPKIDEVRHSSNAAVIGIAKSKLDESVRQSKIQINNYDLLCRDRNRNGGDVACYIRSDISHIQKQYFHKEMKIFSLKFLKFFYLKPSQ